MLGLHEPQTMLIINWSWQQHVMQLPLPSEGSFLKIHIVIYHTILCSLNLHIWTRVPVTTKTRYNLSFIDVINRQMTPLSTSTNSLFEHWNCNRQHWTVLLSSNDYQLQCMTSLCLHKTWLFTLVKGSTTVYWLSDKHKSVCRTQI